MKIELSNIHHNPHRNMERNPVNQEQVETLVDSMKRNDVWPNIVVRPHPERRGEYELAYGHHRITAMRALKIDSAEFIVRDIDDWGMYCAMVDENESQQRITPELVYENITSGLETLEPMIRQCETLDEFRAKVPQGTLANTRPEDYTRVRQCVLNGKGIGGKFLRHVLPGKSSTKTDNLQAVVNSYYGALREKAERSLQEIKEIEAREALRQAEQERDDELRARFEAQAEQAAKEAAEHRKKAFEIAGKTISERILINFETSKHMSEFAAAVARNKVPQHQHDNLANHLISKELAAGKYAKEVAVWWYVHSGQAKADQERAARNQFKIKHSKTLDEFVADLRANLGDWCKKLDAVTEYASELDDKGNAALTKKAQALESSVTRLLAALSADEKIDIKDVTELEAARLNKLG